MGKYHLPLDILIALLNEYHSPLPIFVNKSLKNKDSLYISDSKSSAMMESCCYNLFTGEIYNMSTQWRVLLEEFFTCRESYSLVKKRYPFLFVEGRILDNKYQYESGTYSLRRT